MFDRFTDRARTVMGNSRMEAQKYNHDYIGTEHILLGIVAEGTGSAWAVLATFDLSRKALRQSVEQRIEPGTTMVTMGQLPFTPAAKRVLELAYDEATKLGHHYIGTEHLLPGLIREGEGIAAQVLEHHGVGLAEVRTEVMELLAADVGDANSPDGTMAVQGRPLKTVHLFGLDDPRLPDEQRREVLRVVESLGLTCVPENTAHVLIVFAPELPGAAMYEIGLAIGEGRIVLLLLPPDGTMPARIAWGVQAIPLGARTGDMIRAVLAKQ
jgi:hypothetical protein